MSLIYTLTPSISVGDLTKQTTISSLKLISISINYEDAYTNNGEAVLSVCLADPVSGYPVNVVYRDASALQLAQMIEAQIGPEILLKLSADGRIPPGTLSNV